MAAGRGQMSLGGIQFAKDVEILPSVSQSTTRLSLLGRQASLGDCSKEKIGKQHGVFKGRRGGGGRGFSSSRALQDPNVSIQALVFFL